MSPEETAEIMAEYDRLFAEASAYDHLCRSGNGSCARGDPTCCVVQPGVNRKSCDQLDPVRGCRIKTVMCKIWFCGFIKGIHPELVPLVEDWTKRAARLPGVLFFQSRDDYEKSLGGKDGHTASMG